MRAVWVLRVCLLLSVMPMVGAATRLQDGPRETIRDEFLWRVYRNFGTAEGLPDPTIQTMAQDRGGRIYAGTGAGLARYDGVAWVELPLPVTPAPAVRALLVDSDGQMLVGTDGAGLWRLDTETLIATPVAQAALGALVLDLVAGANGTYWVANDGELLRCRADQCDAFAPTQGLDVYRILPSRWQGQPVLWLGMNDGGVRRVDDPDGAHPQLADFKLGREDGLPNNSVRALATWGGTDNEDLWIGCGRGLARWNGEDLVVYGAGNGFPVAMVFAFQVASSISGRPQLYAALRPGGIATFRDDGTWILQGLASGLPSNDVQALMLSTTGSSRRTLWIGTVDAGIARRDPGQFTLLDERIGIPSRHVHGIGAVKFPDGLVSPWVGTVAGARRWQGGRWQAFMPAAYAERTVRDLVTMDDGSLWAATDRQLLRITPDSVREFNADNSELPAVGVTRLALLGHGPEQQLWIATGHGMARFDVANGLVGVDLSAGQQSIETLFAVDDQSRVFAGLGDGLAVITKDGMARLGHCVGNEPVHAIVMAAEPHVQRLFVATRTRLLRIDPQHPQHCTQVRLAADSGILGGLLIDQRARLYVFSSRAVQRFPIAAIAADGTVAIERFDRSDGLLSPQLRPGRNLWLANDDRIYAATAAGLSAFEPESGLAEVEPSRFYLHSAIRGDGQPMHDGEVLAATMNAVQFEYRLLSFEREHRLRYRSELRGLPDSASDWTAVPNRRFDRLPAGAYTFVATARSADGRESRPIQFGFRVLAPWWQQAWALLTLAALLVAIGLAFGRLRIRVSERRAQKLEEEVRARTSELATANAQLERASLTDPLTGLGNRRYFAIATSGEIERAERRVATTDAHAHLLVMMLDIDHFKRVNDQYGHACGDKVLVEVARRIAGLRRGSDIAARLGGEEFVLIARDIDIADTPSLLLRALHALSDAPIIVDGVSLAVTLSIGAVLVPGATGCDSIDAALACADEALYTAKQAGRDRACLLDAAGESVTVHGRPARLWRRD